MHHPPLRTKKYLQAARSSQTCLSFRLSRTEVACMSDGNMHVQPPVNRTLMRPEGHEETHIQNITLKAWQVARHVEELGVATKNLTEQPPWRNECGSHFCFCGDSLRSKIQTPRRFHSSSFSACIDARSHDVLWSSCPRAPSSSKETPPDGTSASRPAPRAGHNPTPYLCHASTCDTLRKHDVLLNV